MRNMSKLQKWMDRKGLGDEDVAAVVDVSRAQVSRIRRGCNGASIPTAKRLGKLTGIPWTHFLERQPVKKARAA
jgi:transcriptional regulator with XRE-family HTH domain